MPDLHTPTIRGSLIERPPRTEDLPATFGEKRPCAVPGCITHLNRYHQGDRCYWHEAKRFRSVQSVEDLGRLMTEAPGPKPRERNR